MGNVPYWETRLTKIQAFDNLHQIRVLFSSTLVSGHQLYKNLFELVREGTADKDISPCYQYDAGWKGGDPTKKICRRLLHIRNKKKRLNLYYLG